MSGNGFFQNFGPDAFQNSTAVSRETRAALEAYAALLIKWQARINLVGPSTLPDLWRRHFYDSAQLVPMIPESASRLIDLGSGAGFPGLVLAIMTGCETHLIESDGRKGAFLREAARVAGVSDRVTVHTKRAESVTLPPGDVITARALASLEDLFPLVAPFWGPNTIGLFPKGKRYEEELTAIKYGWYVNSTVVSSLVDPDSVILKVTELRRKDETAGEGSAPSKD